MISSLRKQIVAGKPPRRKSRASSQQQRGWGVKAGLKSLTWSASSVHGLVMESWEGRVRLGVCAEKHPGEVELKVIHSAAAGGALMCLPAQALKKFGFLTHLSAAACTGMRVNRWI
ncbi:hypothetical protein NQZ68_008500 [Dissostichus eleginoides]|nr:hypothetical protein NQZ68_008500 [Dissostichus eleginoides]